MNHTYGVYVQTDDTGRITALLSDAFLTSVEGWTKIDEGTGDKYHHAQANYLDGLLRDGYGICRYKLVDGKAVERTQAEMGADMASQSAQRPMAADDLMELLLDQEEHICLLELESQ